MSNKRQHIRHPLQVDIKISHPAIGEKLVKSKDISDGGLFILTEPEGMPSPGEIVMGQVQGPIADAPLLKMKIVRTEKEGLGLQYVFDENNT